MKKILITGASGFIGSFLVEEALKKNYEVYAGIRETSSKQFLQDERIKFFQTSLNDKENLIKSFIEFKKHNGAFDFIIHNAGATKVKNNEDFLKINDQYTRNLIEALIESECLNQKFIFISSLAAYGPGDDKSMLPIKETDTPKPVSFYGKSKLSAEKYLHSLTDFPFLIFRPTGVYGPREKDYLLFFKTLLNRVEPYIGFKAQQLSFIYVKDLCRVIIQSLESSFKNKAYFVADGNVYSSFDFGIISKQKLKVKTIKLYIPIPIARGFVVITSFIFKLFGGSPTLTNEKINEISKLNWHCEIEGIKKDFNFVAKYDLTKGVDETIDWYKKNGWL